MVHCCQLYFTGDEKRECRESCRLNKGVKPNVVLELQEMLHSYNTLVDQFKMCLEKMTGPNYSMVIRADKRPSGTHERQYNALVADKIAVGDDRRPDQQQRHSPAEAQQSAGEDLRDTPQL